MISQVVLMVRQLLVFEVDVFFIVSLSALIILTGFYFFLPPLLNPTDHIDAPHKPSEELLARWKTAYQHPLTLPSIYIKSGVLQDRSNPKDSKATFKLSKLISAFTKAVLNLKTSKENSPKSPDGSQLAPQPKELLKPPVFSSYLELQPSPARNSIASQQNPLWARLAPTNYASQDTIQQNFTQRLATPRMSSAPG